MQLMHNLQIQVGELYRLKIGGGGTPFPRVPPYFDHWWWHTWLSGNTLVLINIVAHHRTRLVLGWVTHLRVGKPSQNVASDLGQLSLLPSVGW